MINKEIILGNGNIVKDFSDRNIPQNSHNQVCVSFLIPSNQFNEFDDYCVLTAVSRIVGGVETPLNALVLTASKSITIDGINYVKFSGVLSLDYTNVIGELRFSPYIQATLHTDDALDDDDIEEEVITEYLLNQNSYTNCKLNVIKAIRIQEDASLEEASTATTLAGQINSKKIYYNAEWNSIVDENNLFYNIANGYNPSVALYKGSIVAVLNQDEVSFYFPYKNGANVELLMMTNEGLFYKVNSIARTGAGTQESPYVYSATKTQLIYSIDEVEAIKTNLQNQIDVLNTNKVDKTTKVNGHALSGDVNITKGDVGLGNVANYGVENATPSASGDQLYITSKAVYDALQAIYGIIATMPSAEDLQTITHHLNSIDTLLGSDDGDDDNIINTLKEIIDTLSGLGEDANILSMINSKVSQTDFNVLNAQINGENGIKDKVDILTSQDNAYMEIKAQSGTIDIAVSDWEANSDDYSSEYPYKWTLTNGYLTGASNVIVVFAIESDTSMLSATYPIDDENGVLTIYASELPSETIKIQKIAVFNSLDAYINYSNTIVQQVLQNTSAISDINNTKLPQYLKQEDVNPNDEDDYSQIIHNYTGLTVNVVENNNPKGFLNVSSYGSYMSYTDSIYGEQGLGLDNEGFKVITTDDNNNTHELTFDANGDLKIDGNAVGGGGKQLYQHNLVIREGGDSNNNVWATVAIISDSSTPFATCDELRYWLESKGFNNDLNTYNTTRKFYLASGRCKSGGTEYIVFGVWNLLEYSQLEFAILSASNSIDRYQISSLSLGVVDTVITL